MVVPGSVRTPTGGRPGVGDLGESGALRRRWRHTPRASASTEYVVCPPEKPPASPEGRNAKWTCSITAPRSNGTDPAPIVPPAPGAPEAGPAASSEAGSRCVPPFARASSARSASHATRAADPATSAATVINRRPLPRSLWLFPKRPPRSRSARTSRTGSPLRAQRPVSYQIMDACAATTCLSSQDVRASRPMGRAHSHTRRGTLKWLGSASPPWSSCHATVEQTTHPAPPVHERANTHCCALSSTLRTFPTCTTSRDATAAAAGSSRKTESSGIVVARHMPITGLKTMSIRVCPFSARLGADPSPRLRKSRVEWPTE